MAFELVVKTFAGDRTEEFTRYLEGPHPEGPTQPGTWIVDSLVYSNKYDLTTVWFAKE